MNGAFAVPSRRGFADFSVAQLPEVVEADTMCEQGKWKRAVSPLQRAVELLEAARVPADALLPVVERQARVHQALAQWGKEETLRKQVLDHLRDDEERAPAAWGTWFVGKWVGGCVLVVRVLLTASVVALLRAGKVHEAHASAKGEAERGAGVAERARVGVAMVELMEKDSREGALAALEGIAADGGAAGVAALRVRGTAAGVLDGEWDRALELYKEAAGGEGGDADGSLSMQRAEALMQVGELSAAYDVLIAGLREQEKHVAKHSPSLSPCLAQLARLKHLEMDVTASEGLFRTSLANLNAYEVLDATAHGVQARILHDFAHLLEQVEWNGEPRVRDAERLRDEAVQLLRPYGDAVPWKDPQRASGEYVLEDWAVQWLTDRRLLPMVTSQ